MIPPWSYTMLSDFGTCPHRAFRKYVKKDLPREEKSPEQIYGTRVHEGLATAINACLVQPSKEPWAQFVNPMIAAGAKAEVRLAMTRDGGPCGYWDNPWGRGAADVVIRRGSTVVLYDWKTGKQREDPRELAIQALLLKANHPEITTVIGAYVWVKENKLGQQHDVSNFQRTYNGTLASTNAMHECEASGHWPKTKGPLCGYCPVRDCENWFKAEKRT